jgi:hypothetical protein
MEAVMANTFLILSVARPDDTIEHPCPDALLVEMSFGRASRLLAKMDLVSGLEVLDESVESVSFTDKEGFFLRDLDSDLSFKQGVCPISLKDVAAVPADVVPPQELVCCVYGDRVGWQGMPDDWNVFVLSACLTREDLAEICKNIP